MYYSEFCCVVLPHCHVVATGEAIAWCGISLQGCWYKEPSPLVSSYNTDAPETKKIKHVVLLLSDLSISKCVSAHLTKGKVNIFYPFFSVLSLNSPRYKYSTRFVTKSLIMLVANLICLLFDAHNNLESRRKCFYIICQVLYITHKSMMDEVKTSVWRLKVLIYDTNLHIAHNSFLF